MTGELLSSEDSESVVRLTLTNLGPDTAYGGDTPRPEDPAAFLYLHFDLQNADLLSTSKPCEDDPASSDNLFPTDRRCVQTRALAAGASITVDVRAKITDARSSFLNAYPVFSAQYCSALASGQRCASQDPNLVNDGARLQLTEPPVCTVKAKSPQLLSKKNLVLRVVAPKESGCKATLSKVVLRIGSKARYRLLQPRTKRLEASETWKLRLVYGASKAAVLRAARKRGKTVSARATFELDGETRHKDIQLK